MTRIGHIFDDAAGWEQRVAVSQLLDRLPSDRMSQRLIALDHSAAVALSGIERPVELIPSRLGVGALSAPRLRAHLAQGNIDLIHAWGATAGATARAASDRPIVIELFDPQMARRNVKLMRSLADAGPLAIVTGSQIVRRRLLEGGLPPEQVAVIRPGVDFARINRFRRGDLKSRLDLPHDHRLIVLPPPVSRDGGHFDAAYAVAILNRVDRPCCAVLQDASREADRIVRFHRALPIEKALCRVAHDVSLEELIAVSDAIVVAARGDVSTTALAWAMAAETTIVAAAGYAVTELVANKVNGLLFKQTPGRSMMPAIARCLSDRASIEKTREVARGQAYEIFGLRRYVEDHIRLYENVLNRRAPGTGIEDPANVA